jgi:hypothetical protein
MSSASDIAHRQPFHQFSMIEIDGNIYYLSSLHADDCIINYSQTMSTHLLEMFTTYTHSLSTQKITTVVFENIPPPAPSATTAPQQPPEKKVVGFWNPQLSKFILHNA